MQCVNHAVEDGEGYGLDLNGTMYAMRTGCNVRADLLKVSTVGLLLGVCHVLKQESHDLLGTYQTEWANISSKTRKLN